MRRITATIEQHPGIAFTATLAVCLVFSHNLLASLPGDQWFILGNGKYILEHGFPYTNPFTVWGGGIIIENWLYAVIAYVLWQLVGQNQLGIWILVETMSILILALVWLIARRTMKASVLASSTALVLTAVFIQISFNVRPSMASMLMALTALWIQLEYMKTRDLRILAMLVPLTCFAFNLHMAMGWYTILVPGCFMLVDVIRDNAHAKRLLTYASIVILQALSTLINPYGVKGVLFLPESSGAMKYGANNIENMSVINCFKDASCIYSFNYQLEIGALVLLSSLIGLMFARREWKSFDQYHKTVIIGNTVMVAGIALSCAMAVRSVQTFILLIPLGAVSMFNAFSVSENEDKRAKSPIIGIMMASMVLITLLSVEALSINQTGRLEADSLNGRSSSIDIAAKMALENASIEDPIATDGVLGEKIGFLGYKITNDMRPELISANKITGLKTDRYKEFVDARNDQSKADAYVVEMSKHTKWWVSFDTNKTLQKALKNNSSWKLVESRNGVSLYRNLGWKD